MFNLNLTFYYFISDYSYVDSKTFSGVFQNIHDSFEELSSAHCNDKNAQFSPGEQYYFFHLLPTYLYSSF